MKTLSIVFVAALALFVSMPAHAQLSTGTILGTVTDPSGSAIPGAKVVVTNTGTRISRTTTTAVNGDYVVSLLQPGTYSVTITAQGFKAFTVSAAELSAGDRLREDAKLLVGAVTQTVTVQAQPSALQTDTSVVSTTITQSAVENVPLNGRNFIQLIQTQPGVNQGPTNALTNGLRPIDLRQTAAFSSNGQQDVLNNSMIDGADNNTRGTQDIAVRPALDAIAEMQVETNDYPADVGRTPGAVVNVITKSGTNQFHGDVFEFLRNDITDATAYSFGHSLPKSKLRWNQFGGSISGPIIKNKAFFFGAYEGYRLRSGQSPEIYTVPTLYEQQHPGNFSDVGGPVLCTSPGVPAGCTGSIDPVGLAYFKLYPAPNSGTDQFFGVPTESQNSDDFDLRSDVHLNQNNSGFARFIYNKATTNLPGGLPNATVDGLTLNPNSPFVGTGDDLDYNAMLSFTHIFTPNLLTRVFATYTRSDNKGFPHAYGLNPNEHFGQPNVNYGPGGISGLAPIFVIGGTNLGDTWFVPVIHAENAFQYSGDIVYTHGSHNLKFGVSLLRRQVHTVQSSFPEGLWIFLGFTNLLQGSYLTVQRSLDLFPPNFRMWEASGYVQDDWRVTRRATLNLGLRYDVYTPYVEHHLHASTFDPVTGGLLVAGQNGVSNTAGLVTDYRGVEPRLGVAFDLGHGLVIRGGYGITFFPMNTAAGADEKNPPFIAAVSSCGVMAISPVKCPSGMTRFADGFPTPVAMTASSPGFTIPAGIDPNYRTSYIHQFNLTVQKQAFGNVFTVSYIGELGKDLSSNLPDLNAPPPNTASGAAFQALRPYNTIDPNLGRVSFTRSDASSNYNALQASVDRRISHGLSLQLNYTYAQNLTNGSSISTQGGGYGIVPSRTLSLDYGNSAIAVRNILNGTIHYALPFGQNAHGLEAGVIKGWQVNVLGVWQTSNPFTVTNSTNVSNTVPGTGDRPNVIADPNLSNPSLSEWFNTGAFKAQTPGTLGNEGISQYFGPHFRHLDLGLTKTFTLTERLKMNFTAQSFNLFNTPNFANPNSTLGGSHYGQITSMLSGYTPRVFQFALKLQF